MDALIRHCQNDTSKKIVLVLSNNPEAPALEKAKKAGIKTVVIDSKKISSKEEYDHQLISELEKHKPDLIVLAGYMKIISKTVVDHFKNKIINIHPSLLPAFPGLHAQKQALEAKVKTAGCTVHYVDEGCDTGPIILQASVPVLENDTEESLSARILEQEHLLLPKAVDLIAKNKI